MTYEDILDNHDLESLWFKGEELQAFCDLLESHGQFADWERIRRSEYIVGQHEARRTWMDEEPRLWVGQALGRDWYIPA